MAMGISVLIAPSAPYVFITVTMSNHWNTTCHSIATFGSLCVQDPVHSSLLIQQVYCQFLIWLSDFVQVHS